MCQQMVDRLHIDLGVVVGTSSIHHALQGMIYSVKKLRIEKVTMNNTTNKDKRKKFVEALNKHIKNGDMIIYHDETNFNMYLSRGEGWSRVGERATVALPPSQGANLHVQGGVSFETGIILMQTHDGSIRKEENARFVAGLIVAAQSTVEYRELEPSNNVVVVTDNAPAHSQVESLVIKLLVTDGILNGSRLVLLRLAPYTPMLNPIEGCWNVLKTYIKRYVAERKEDLLVRGKTSLRLTELIYK
ncbi:Transposase [Phytophthora megakarya]|uniref:Transposase n=1 Tax=Phytophthora megakarya TaxID=4795 RepID=A0A225UN65_9STRA|nr:Transposase [Phytophthora megakarya]